MTERDWLACADPETMLRFLSSIGMARDRKLRLFAVACYRHVSDLSYDDVEWEAVEVAERHADGLATDQELREAHAQLDSSGDYRHRPAHEATATDRGLIETSRWTAAAAADLAVQANLPLAPECVSAEATEKSAQASLLRDIFGPLGPLLTLPPRVLTPTVVQIAQVIYEERKAWGLRPFANMPILADALEEAGCDNEDVLSHCRGDGPHVRGCWVVDLVLGKS